MLFSPRPSALSPRPSALSPRPSTLDPHSSNAARIHSKAGCARVPRQATTSNRHGASVSAGCACRKTAAARRSFARLAAPTEAMPSPWPAERRKRTSTNTTQSRSRMMRSISPWRQVKLRASGSSPASARYAAAASSQDEPTARIGSGLRGRRGADVQAAVHRARRAVVELRPHQQALDATGVVLGELAGGAGQVAVVVLAQPFEIRQQGVSVEAEREQPCAGAARAVERARDRAARGQAGRQIEQPRRIAELHAVEIAVEAGIV